MMQNERPSREEFTWPCVSVGKRTAPEGWHGVLLPVPYPVPCNVIAGILSRRFTQLLCSNRFIVISHNYCPNFFHKGGGMQLQLRVFCLWYLEVGRGSDDAGGNLVYLKIYIETIDIQWELTKFAVFFHRILKLYFTTCYWLSLTVGSTVSAFSVRFRWVYYRWPTAGGSTSTGLVGPSDSRSDLWVQMNSVWKNWL